MHLLVDAGSFGHEEETLATALAVVAVTGVEDINGLEGHLLETGLVIGVLVRTIRIVLLVFQIFLVDISVEPFSHDASGEDTKGTVVIGSLGEGCGVPGEAVSLLFEHLVVILLLIVIVGEEVLGTSAKENIGAIPLSPGVVGETVEVSVDNMSTLATVTSVGSQGSRGGIGQVSSRNDTDTSTRIDTAEDLSNGLEFGVIERRLGRVTIHVQCIDSGLVASVECGGRIGRVGDEGVHGMGHLVAKDGELVHLHLRLVLAIDRLMGHETSSSDHVGSHTIANEEDDVLRTATGAQLLDLPGSGGFLAIVVG